MSWTSTMESVCSFQRCFSSFTISETGFTQCCNSQRADMDVLESRSRLYNSVFIALRKEKDYQSHSLLLSSSSSFFLSFFLSFFSFLFFFFLFVAVFATSPEELLIATKSFLLCHGEATSHNVYMFSQITCEYVFHCL